MSRRTPYWGPEHGVGNIRLNSAAAPVQVGTCMYTCIAGSTPYRTRYHAQVLTPCSSFFLTDRYYGVDRLTRHLLDDAVGKLPAAPHIFSKVPVVKQASRKHIISITFNPFHSVHNVSFLDLRLISARSSLKPLLSVT